MSDFDLDRLAKLQPPAPDPGARERAAISAMDAFDGAALEKKSSETQGLANADRPTSIPTRIWRNLMNNAVRPVWNMKPATMALLSGVCLLPIGGIVAWQIFEQDQLQVEQTQPTDVAVEERADKKISQPKELPKLSADDQSGRSVAEPKVAPAQEQEMKAEADSTVASPAPAPAKRVQRSRLAEGLAGSRESGVAMRAERPALRFKPQPQSEKYPEFASNGVKSVLQQPVSTFSIDVDTASYSRVRRSIMAGQLPSKDMVRVEELVNYFDYDYALPESREQPFQPNLTVTPTPWNQHTNLLHIGIKGFDVPRTEQPKANLVFLLDVSGSMSSADKLPLLIKSFRLLLNKLNPDDTVSIVTYAGAAGVVLEPTRAGDKPAIFSALENLQAGGSTAGGAGIERAYQLAEENFVKGGVNRVMLATDGDFNVGISHPEQLKTFIAEKRKSGVFLSVFGFGTGNTNDTLMQALAQNGNGQAAYIDTLSEAQKVLVEEAGGTLFPIAKDVKIQMEFDPAKIAEYRLIGYETRALKREDFNNDKIDAGDIGAGHSVTAIYEITPVGSPAVLTEPLRYSETKVKPADNPYGEIGFLKMRYKLPNETRSRLLSEPVINPDNALIKLNHDAVFPPETRFAAAVAAFGQKLRGNPAVSDFSYEEIATLASGAKGKDPFGYRGAFVQLVRLAASLGKN